MKHLLIFLALTACAWSQPTMPFAMWKSAAVASFSPADLDSLRAWYVASDITGKNDGDTLYYWPDKSGNGRHLYQLTASRKPTFQTNESNGQPGVQFDGGDDFIQHVQAGQEKRGQHIVLVWKSTGAHSNKYALEFGTSGANAVISGYTAGKAEFFDAPRLVYGNSPTVYTMMSVNDSLAAGRRSLYVNGANVATGLNVGIRTNSGITIGATNGGSGPCPMICLEAIIYDGDRSAAEIAQLWQYVQTRYGL